LPYLEAGVGVVYGRIVEGLRIPFSRDEYYETIIVPGFSDTHAHPQVVDGGISDETVGSWRNSYHWLEERRLVVDEAAVRGDIGLSSHLAQLALKRALLEGVTLVAFTGRLEANLKARIAFPYGPRLVLLPTIMDRAGWARPSDVAVLYSKYSRFIRDSLLRPGVFVHSIRYASRETVLSALNLAATGRMPLGLHLSEGVPEMKKFSSILAGASHRPRVVAVHCISDDPRELGIRCSSCPGTNMVLYGRTRPGLAGTTSFGSDWPHLIGTVPRHLGLIRKLYGNKLEPILYRATMGGYLDYGVPAAGDLVAYDASLSEVMSGRVLPRLVTVAGNVVVEEGVLVPTGETLDDVERDTLDTIGYAVEAYGTGERVYVPGPELVWRIEEGLARARGVERHVANPPEYRG